MKATTADTPEQGLYCPRRLLLQWHVTQRCNLRCTHCYTAGDTLITVQPNGDLYPCRRMPIRVGNLIETPLGELYYKSDLFRALRNRDRVSDGCQDCCHRQACRGGLKCLSYAVTGDPLKADPGCFQRSSGRDPATVRPGFELRPRVGACLAKGA